MKTVPELLEELEDLLDIPKNSRTGDVTTRITTIKAILEQENVSVPEADVSSEPIESTSVDPNFSERSSGDSNIEAILDAGFNEIKIPAFPMLFKQEIQAIKQQVSQKKTAFDVVKEQIDLPEDHYVFIEPEIVSEPILTKYGSSIIDRLLGTAGKDSMFGLDGNDKFHTSSGNDSFFGGSGTDTIDFSRTVGSTGVLVDLALSQASSNVTGNDVLDSIENVTGSDQDDILNGDNSNNVLSGGEGDDSLFGLGGSDTLIGGKGADILNGGSGDDIFMYKSGDLDGSLDIIKDYDIAEGDKIDVSELLSGYDLVKSDVTNFARFVDQGADTILQINTMGTGAPADFADLATITGGAGLNIESVIKSGGLVTDSTLQESNILMEGLWTAYNSYAGRVAVSDNYTLVGASGFTDANPYQGAAFIYGANGSSYMLTNPVPEDYSYFGGSLEINNNHAIISTSSADTAGQNGSGAARLYDLDTGNILFSFQSPNVVAGNQFGNDVDISDNYIAIAEQYNDTGGSNSGAVHIYNTGDGSLVRTITNPSANASDYFGNNIALHDNILVAGAYRDDTAGSSSGAAYLFDVTTGAKLFTLVDPNSAAGNYFGNGVAISAQYAAVSATGDDTDALSSGMAYVYDVTTGDLVSTLHNASADNNDGTGYVLSISNNYIISGNAYDDTYSGSSGVVHIYNAITGDVVQSFFGKESETRMGASIDATDTILVVGASGNDYITESTAEAFVYITDFLDTGIVNGDATNNSLLGLDGDDVLTGYAGDDILIGSVGSDDLYGGAGSDTFAFFDADISAGIDTIHDFTVLEGDVIDIRDISLNINVNSSFYDYMRIVDQGGYGALQIDVNGTGVDANYITIAHITDGQDLAASVLYNNSQILANIPTLDPGALIDPTPVASAMFGEGGFVTDKYTLVTSPLDSTDIYRGGSADVYDTATGAHLYKIDNPTPNSRDYFGIGTTIYGDIGVISSFGDDSAGSYTGAFYIYDLTTGNLTNTILNPTATQYTEFGYWMDSYENLMIVSASDDDTLGSNVGRAYIYDIVTGNLVRTIENPVPVAGDEFGSSVQISESYYFVGAKYEDTGEDRAGTGYLYDKATGNLLHTIHNPEPEAADYFAGSSALSDKYLVVGNESDDFGEVNAGTAFVFDPLTGSLLQTIHNPDPHSGDFFSTDIEIFGDYAAISSQREDATADNAGAVYVFDLRTGGLVKIIESSSPEAYDEFGVTVKGEGEILIVGSRYGDDSGEGVGSLQKFLLDFAEDGNVTGTVNDDIIMGLSGDDLLLGGAGNDYVYGDDGDDMLRGGAGDDTLYGGVGADDLYGDGGADTFSFIGGSLDAVDTVYDFDTGEGDRIDLSDLLQGYDPLDDAISDFVHVDDQGSNAIVSIDIDGTANGENFVDAISIISGAGLNAEDMIIQGSLDVIV